MARPRTLRSLSVRQPWASAIFAGVKLVENRSWPTTHRGPLVIHAAATRADLADASAIRWRRLLRGLPPADELPRGVLLGVVTLIDCVPCRGQHRRRLAADPFATGPWCWLLADPRPLARPVPWRGRLGLFPVPLRFAGTAK